ncbi:LysE family transporter [Paenarthrobacter sp. Z7-10]|uniref:LysE family transporter n=1 Tax=Paenarthrobacter sp. Z7-10 TaxID=2787635 RepID=UPI0022A911F5|nr:LysE family transporter [Paenarthrobacter sp. Z7-10]MCZ2401859.1 LysE family transporter [Paenarthrobacter sp. Z7-10]
MEFSLWLPLAGAGAMISLTPGAGAINTMSNAISSGFRRAIWGILGQQLALIVHITIVAAGVGLLVASSPLAFHVIRYAGAAYLVYLGIRKLLAKLPTVSARTADGLSVAGDPFRGTEGGPSRASGSLPRTGSGLLEAHDLPETRSALSEASGGFPGANGGLSGPSGRSVGVVDRSLDAAETTARTGDSARAMFLRGLWVNLLNPKAIVFFLAFMPQFIRADKPLLGQYTVLAATVVAIDVAVMWFVFAAAAKQMRHLGASERGQMTLNRVFGSLFIVVGILLAVL